MAVVWGGIESDGTFQEEGILGDGIKAGPGGLPGNGCYVDAVNEDYISGVSVNEHSRCYASRTRALRRNFKQAKDTHD